MKRRAEESTADKEQDADIHPARKRRLEYSEADKQLAQLYNDLSDEVKSTRIKAAAGLVRTLKDAEPARLDEAITRLVKGLCSSRKASRSGFFVALIEVLSLTKGLDVSPSASSDLSPRSLIHKIELLTQPDGASNNREKRDYLLGRCVAFKALIQSKILFQHAGDKGSWELLVDHTISQSIEHVGLRKDFGAVLYESLPLMTTIKDVDASYASVVLQKLHSANLARTAEGLAIWLTATQSFQDLSPPKGVWHHHDPLNSKERAAVAKILRDNSDTETADSTHPPKASGTSQSMPSFAWTPVLRELYKRHLSSGKASEFDKFWIEAVDNGYFSANASTERKAIGFRLAAQAVATAPPQLFRHIFSPHLLRCLINQRGDASHYLFQLAKAPLDALSSRIKADSECAFYVFEALATGNGPINFDQLSKAKTVDEALARMPVSKSKDVLELMQTSIMQPKVTEHLSAEVSRRFSADLLLNYLRKPSQSENTGLALDILKLLSTLAFVAPAGKANQDASPAVHKDTQELFRNRTMSCLSHVLNSKSDVTGKIPYQLVVHIDEKVNANGYKLWVDLEKQIKQNVRTAVETASRLAAQETKAKSDKKRSTLSAFKLLYSLTIIQVYNGDADAVAVLDDLDTCYASWKKSDNDASLVLVEIILSFASKPSALFRKLAEQVFSAFTSQLTAEGLQSMLDILEKKENLSGQQELFANADEELDGEEEEDDDEDDDDEEDSDVEELDGEDVSDVEMIDGESENGDEDGEDDSEDDSSASVDDDEDDDDAGSVDDEQQAFEAKLAQALGTSAATKGDGDGEDDETSDESDMDDDQMTALDDHLTTIFKERSKQSSKKQDNKDAKETIINFKNRVLDLLLIYVKQEHANPLVLDIILPIITLIRTTTSKQTSEKAFAVLKQIPDACNKDKKFPDDVEPSVLLKLLSTITKELRYNASKMHSNACSRTNLFLAKMLVNKDASHYDAVADIYVTLQKEWYADAKSTIQPSIFTEFTSWSIATKKR